MRKYIFISACLIFLASCANKTNEQKAQELIEPDIKSHLIKPESYEFAEMTLDSCFSDDSQRNPEAIIFALKLAKAYKEYKEYLSDAERAESSMTIYAPSFGYQDAHSKQQQKKYKAEMEKAQRKAAVAKENILQLYKDNEKMFQAINDGKHDFTGWTVAFSYRAETAGGLKTMGGALYFLNKELTEITNRFTEEDLEVLKDGDLEDLRYEFEDELKEMFGTEQE